MSTTNIMKTIEKTTISLLSLYCSTNNGRDILIEEESGIEANTLILYLDDKNDRKSHFDELVKVELSLETFASIIEKAELNSYEGVLYSESGRPYEGRVVIAEPIKWFTEDATSYERDNALSAALAYSLEFKNLLS